MALLTIIMPVYNASAFIKEAVESILHQTFQDFELWIVDDASTDDSIAIVKSFQDSRIKFFLNGTNFKRMRTVNQIVKKVSTPYFTITDADDVSHSQRLEKQINFLESNIDFMMCGTSFWAMDTQGFLFRKIELLTDVGKLREKALEQSQFIAASTIMRKSVLEYFPEFYREYIGENFADADLSCMILDKFKATNINEPLYFYRIVHGSLSRRDITIRTLNLNKLVGFLSRQRREQGQDCLQRNAAHEANEFLNTIQKKYDTDPSFFFRHQAFFHLYWGLNDLAFKNGLKAFFARPLYWKNLLSLGLIVFRIGVFLLTRGVNKKHYSRLINH
jgi:glycosyltransferase involved in cell wall biosynthesis